MTRAEMLGLVMRHANSRGYKGKGHVWGYHRPPRLEAVLETEDWQSVLRSEAFCRRFWGPDLMAGAGTYDAASPPDHLHFAVVTEAILEAWKRHHRALATAVDPLRYCVEHFQDIS